MLSDSSCFCGFHCKLNFVFEFHEQFIWLLRQGQNMEGSKGIHAHLLPQMLALCVSDVKGNSFRRPQVYWPQPCGTKDSSAAGSNGHGFSHPLKGHLAGWLTLPSSLSYHLQGTGHCWAGHRPRRALCLWFSQGIQLHPPSLCSSREAQPCLEMKLSLLGFAQLSLITS